MGGKTLVTIHLVSLFPHCFVCDFSVVRGMEKEKTLPDKGQDSSGELEGKKGMKDERSGGDDSLSRSEFEE